MIRNRILIIGFFVFAALVVLGNASAQGQQSSQQEAKRQALLKAAMESIPTDDEDKTLSPYFFVLSDDPSLDQMPMKSTRADVDIAGVIADVTVTQMYKNEGKKTLEAIYIFPASTRAAVNAMKMTIGTRVIEAEIKEREKARQEYEKARQEGKTASLLEQHRPNVFQMNVANILPGDEIKVELKYTELLIPEDNVYEFIYPTVVGPRYSNVKEKGASSFFRWIKNPFLRSGEKAPYTFGIDVNINAGIPIAQLTSTSHDIAAEYAGKARAHVGLKESKDAGNRDFILKYSLAGNRIESGLLLYQGKKENFFLLMMEPPKRVVPAAIVPREYIFIIDVSGSMHGFPLDVTKELMSDLFSKLRPNDYFNVLLFAGGNEVLSEKSIPATKPNIERALDVVTRQQGGGGTELIPALKRALALPRTRGTSRIMVIATDGYVAVEKDAFELIRNNLGEANLFSFGIGSSVNRYIVEGMARAGRGEPFIITSKGEAAEKAATFREYIRSPLLTGIKVAFDGFDAYDVEPAAVPDLFAQRPLVVFGKYRGSPSGKVVITGRTAANEYKKVIPVAPNLESSRNTALRYLWARERIMYLGDMNKLDKTDARVKEITRLGLTYNLMTDYTSFIAVDKLVRADGTVETVKQPLPLPSGVSDYAVGDMVGAGMMTMAAPMAPPPPMAREVEVKQKPAPQVTVKKVIILQGKDPTLSAEAIERKVDTSTVISCYGKALASKPKLKGTMTIKLTIDAKGKVTAIEVVKDATKDHALMTCVRDALRALSFPAPTTSTKVVATVVLEFKP